jgi:hypothetical protein
MAMRIEPTTPGESRIQSGSTAQPLRARCQSTWACAQALGGWM